MEKGKVLESKQLCLFFNYIIFFNGQQPYWGLLRLIVEDDHNI